MKSKHVQVSLNAENGIYISGAEKAELKDVLAIANGAFGIDVDTALELEINDSNFIAKYKRHGGIGSRGRGGKERVFRRNRPDTEN